MIWLKTSNLKRTRTKGWKRWYVKFNLNCNKFWILFQTNLTSLEGLSKFIDPSQLTPDLEGGLSYDHGIWIELRCVSTAFRLLRQTERLCFISLLSMWQEYCYSAVCYLSCLMGILNRHWRRWWFSQLVTIAVDCREHIPLSKKGRHTDEADDDNLFIMMNLHPSFKGKNYFFSLLSQSCDNYYL